MASHLQLLVLVVISSLLLKSESASVPVSPGLSYSFYSSNCPKLESIVRNHLKQVFQKDITQAAGLLRLHFHDCFVQSGGPNYNIPLGRRDSVNFATQQVTLDNLPAPFSNTTVILNSLASKRFDATDVVALSGGHTIGRGHCSSFTERLYPKQDGTMDQTFAKNLKVTCPAKDTDSTTNLDIRSPNVFDNKYYVDLMNRQGLFTSDQDLYTDSRTKEIVRSFAINQNLFFEKFVNAMLKMGQLGVLTGTQGEIRANCLARNAKKVDLWSVVDEVAQEELSQLF